MKVFKPDSCLTKFGCQLQNNVIFDLVKVVEALQANGVGLAEAMLLLHDSVGPAAQTVLNRKGARAP